MKIVIFFLIFTVSLWGAEVTDMFDRVVKIEQTEKILAIGPGTLRLLTYMQLQDRLVGIENLELDFNYKAPYRRVLDKNFIQSLPVIGQGGPSNLPNIEAVIKTEADIIFTSFLSKNQVQMLQDKTGIPVVALSYGSNYGGKEDLKKLQAIKKSLKLLGEIFEKQKRAEELVKFMDKNELVLKSFELRTDAYIGGIGYKGAKGLTSTESNYPPFELLGLENAVKLNKNGHSQIHLETLLLTNPQMIFLDMLGQRIILQEIEKNKKLFQSLKAYKEKKIYWLYPYNFYNTNVENVYLNAYIIASKMGVALDIEKIKEEIYTKFLGINHTEQLPVFTYEY